MEKRIEAELHTQKFTVEDAKRMFENLSEAFADKSVGDMWSMGFLTTMHVTDILDLLNSQKAEIENKNVEIDILIRKKESLRDEISELTAEVERLQTKNNVVLSGIVGEKFTFKMLMDNQEIYGKNKVKEFAERLKEVGTKVEGRKGFEGVNVMVNNFQIDNLVKEMEGDDDA